MLRRIVLPLLLLLFTVSVFSKTDDKPYVLVVSLDGFRWDYLDRNLSPNLKKMENDGVRALTFKPVFPSKTFPSHYSMVTGLYPEHHGIIGNGFIDNRTGEHYLFKDSVSCRDAKWYHGEPIWEKLRHADIKSASFFWPGSEADRIDKQPTYFMKFNKSTPHKERIEGIINWLRLPEKERPHLLFLYFCDTDTKGHLFGPHSSEMDEAILFLDRQIGYLFKRLKDISFLDRMNIIVLSDHGMTELSRKKIVDVSEVINRHHLICSGKSPVINFFVKAGEDKQAAFADLKGKARGYKVYLKENIPPYYHYADSPLIGDILLIADKGYTVLVRKKASEFYLKKKGDHGFDNNLLDMQGIFLASGPQFKRRYRVGQLRNIDLYPLLCRIFGLGQQENIDGRIEQIEFILK